METRSPSFATDIRPLFRDTDRRAMTFLFDLWEFEDVKANSDQILASIKAGDMPCDGGWPAAQVERFRAWIAGGCEP